MSGVNAPAAVATKRFSFLTLTSGDPFGGRRFGLPCLHIFTAVIPSEAKNGDLVTHMRICALAHWDPGSADAVRDDTGVGGFL